MSLKYFENLKIIYLTGKQKSDPNGKKCSRARFFNPFAKHLVFEKQITFFQSKGVPGSMSLEVAVDISTVHGRFMRSQ